MIGNLGFFIGILFHTLNYKVPFSHTAFFIKLNDFEFFQNFKKYGIIVQVFHILILMQYEVCRTNNSNPIFLVLPIVDQAKRFTYHLICIRRNTLPFSVAPYVDRILIKTDFTYFTFKSSDPT